jgi:hypothetical protein
VHFMSELAFIDDLPKESLYILCEVGVESRLSGVRFEDQL